MSMDILQEKIRKKKSPLVLEPSFSAGEIPPCLLEEAGNAQDAYARFCRELLSSLKGIVPAVRFSWTSFTLLGSRGSEILSELMRFASEQGYYVLLDCPELMGVKGAEQAAEAFFGPESAWPCDGLVINPYLGSDVIKPFLPYCREAGKDLFLLARTGNKSAAEIQDLLTGSRLVHTAVTDLVARYGEGMFGRYPYSQVAAVAGASSAQSIRTLRAKYKRMFLLVDGLDYPGGNGKNCSFAFDQLGHGAAICVGSSVTAAWQAEEYGQERFAEAAVQAAERIRGNLARYFTIL